MKTHKKIKIGKPETDTFSALPKYSEFEAENFGLQ